MGKAYVANPTKKDSKFPWKGGKFHQWSGRAKPETKAFHDANHMSLSAAKKLRNQRKKRALAQNAMLWGKLTSKQYRRLEKKLGLPHDEDGIRSGRSKQARKLRKKRGGYAWDERRRKNPSGGGMRKNEWGASPMAHSHARLKAAAKKKGKSLGEYMQDKHGKSLKQYMYDRFGPQAEEYGDWGMTYNLAGKEFDRIEAKRTKKGKKKPKKRERKGESTQAKRTARRNPRASSKKSSGKSPGRVEWGKKISSILGRDSKGRFISLKKTKTRRATSGKGSWGAFGRTGAVGTRDPEAGRMQSWPEGTKSQHQRVRALNRKRSNPMRGNPSPVVYDWRDAFSLSALRDGAVEGGAILLGKMGANVFSTLVSRGMSQVNLDLGDALEKGPGKAVLNAAGGIVGAAACTFLGQTGMDCAPRLLVGGMLAASEVAAESVLKMVGWGGSKEWLGLGDYVTIGDYLTVGDYLTQDSRVKSADRIDYSGGVAEYSDVGDYYGVTAG